MLVKGMSRLNWMSQSEQHILHTWCLTGWCVKEGEATLAAGDVSQRNEMGRTEQVSLSNIPGASLKFFFGLFWKGKQLWKLMNWVSLNWVSQSEQHTWCLTEGFFGLYWKGKQLWKLMNWVSLNWISHLRNIPGASLNVFFVCSGRGSNSGSWWTEWVWTE